MEPDNLRRSWGEIRQRAGLPATRFHDLRHPCVTLLDLGAPPHVAREIVGHSAIEVTMTIYARVSLDEKRKALESSGAARLMLLVRMVVRGGAEPQAVRFQV